MAFKARIPVVKNAAGRVIHVGNWDVRRITGYDEAANCLIEKEMNPMPAGAYADTVELRFYPAEDGLVAFPADEVRYPHLHAVA